MLAPSGRDGSSGAWRKVVVLLRIVVAGGQDMLLHKLLTVVTLALEAEKVQEFGNVQVPGEDNPCPDELRAD